MNIIPRRQSLMAHSLLLYVVSAIIESPITAEKTAYGGIDPPPIPDPPTPDPPTPIPDPPTPDPGDIVNPNDPSTWPGIPDDISDHLAEAALHCIIRAFGTTVTNPTS